MSDVSASDETQLAVQEYHIIFVVVKQPKSLRLKRKKLVMVSGHRA